MKKKLFSLLENKADNLWAISIQIMIHSELLEFR